MATGWKVAAPWSRSTTAHYAWCDGPAAATIAKRLCRHASRWSPATVRFRRPMQDRAQVDAIFFDAGGGHRASAIALKEVVERQRRPWHVRLVNLREVLDPIDVIHKVTRVRAEDFYNRLLKYGWTVGSGTM